ncbi:hypothetical protein ABIC08_006882 [Bradyrhizobium sp. RT9b]|uniref:hypothetical protein n=1 Tax=Bradyrhizobium sp. RT9b TaxID=3156385 RepID=UPI00339A9BB1
MADDKPKPRPKKKKDRRGKAQDQTVRYMVAIETWDWSYAFGLAGRKDSLDPYSEYRHLMITGKLLHPTNPSIGSVELWLLPTEDLDEGKRKNEEPNSVGSLSVHDGRLNGLMSIPKNALTPILQMLIAGRFKFVDLGGTKLRYREALVRSFGLATHLDEDDRPWTGDET